MIKQKLADLLCKFRRVLELPQLEGKEPSVEGRLEEMGPRRSVTSNERSAHTYRRGIGQDFVVTAEMYEDINNATRNVKR